MFCHEANERAGPEHTHTHEKQHARAKKLSSLFPDDIRLPISLLPTLFLLLNRLRHPHHQRHTDRIQLPKRMLDRAPAQLTVPFIQHLPDLPRRLVHIYLNNTINHLLRAHAHHLVLGAQIHGDRVPGPRDLVREALDARKGGAQPVPLRGELRAALGHGERVLEGCGVGPEREFAQRRLAREEVEHRGRQQGLLVCQGYAGGGAQGRGRGLEFEFFGRRERRGG